MPSVASIRFHSDSLRRKSTAVRLLCSVLLIATFCLFLPPLSQAVEPREVRAWTFDFPPGIFKGEDDRIQGWFVDLLEEIGRQENLAFTFEYGSWAEGLERASHDQIDLLTSVAWTAERATFLDYGKVPIVTVWAELYSREDSTVSRIDQLEGLTIAVMRKDYNAQTFKSTFDLPATYLECDSFDEVFLAIESRRADVGVVSRLVAGYRAQDYRVRHTGISVNPFDIFFATPKGHDPALLARIDHWLETWRQQDNSFYYQSHHQWRSPGEPARLKKVPAWVWNALAIVLAVTVLGIIWIVVLRRQVHAATANLLLREQRLQMIVDIVQSESENATELLDKALLQALNLTASQFGYVYFYSEETHQFTLQSWSEGVMPACYILEPQTTYHLDKTGIWGEVVRQRKPIVINDFHADNPLKKGYPQGHVPLDRFMSIPVFSAGCIVAVVGVANKVAPYEQTDVLQLTLLMERIWKVIDRAEITTELRKKNAEMERFLYAASHDLKTPLVTIKNFLGFLTIDLKAGDQERVVESTGYIARAADRMSLLLDELIAYARIGHLEEQVEEICAGDLPRQALVELQDDFSRRNARAVVTDLDIPLKGSRRRLAEIWRNLLQNAVNHLGDQPAPFIEAGQVASEGETRFYVRDNGIGIDARYHQKIFGLFERLDANAPGAGLGLALVKQVVEHYGGCIWVESEGPGQGSCFWFTLPKAVASKTLGARR